MRNNSKANISEISDKNNKKYFFVINDELVEESLNENNKDNKKNENKENENSLNLQSCRQSLGLITSSNVKCTVYL